MGLIRTESVGELVFIEDLNSNGYLLKDSVRNNLQYRYRNRISLYIDEDPQMPVMEFFLIRDIDKIEKDKQALSVLIGCLRRYERSDIIEKLSSEGFFK